MTFHPVRNPADAASVVADALAGSRLATDGHVHTDSAGQPYFRAWDTPGHLFRVVVTAEHAAATALGPIPELSHHQAAALALLAARGQQGYTRAALADELAGTGERDVAARVGAVVAELASMGLAAPGRAGGQRLYAITRKGAAAVATAAAGEG